MELCRIQRCPSRVERMFKLILLLAMLSYGCAFGQQPTGQKVTRPKVVCRLKPNPAKLLKKVKPSYPAHVDAKAIADGVDVHLIIDKQGVPKDLHIIKGDPALTKPVLDALRQWRWKPYKLNGEPVEADTNVYVRFEAPRD